MSQPAAPRGSATIEDLYRVPDNGKAEIVEGELVLMSPTGFLPGRASWAICASLRKYEEETGRGYSIPDNVGFIVDLPNRRSFSPHAAFYVGEPTGGSSCRALRSSRPRCEARKITAPPRRRRWRPREPTTSRRAHASCGTWTSFARGGCGCTPRRSRPSHASTVSASARRPSPSFPVGLCRSTTS